jgi:hypothetical protein
MRVDDGRDRIRRVMEAVDELEPERDQQRNSEQNERADGNWRRMGGIDIGEQTVQCVADADGQQNNKDHTTRDVRPGVEVGSRGQRCRDGFGHCYTPGVVHLCPKTCTQPTIAVVLQFCRAAIGDCIVRFALP